MHAESCDIRSFYQTKFDDIIGQNDNGDVNEKKNPETQLQDKYKIRHAAYRLRPFKMTNINIEKNEQSCESDYGNYKHVKITYVFDLDHLSNYHKLKYDFQAKCDDSNEEFENNQKSVNDDPPTKKRKLNHNAWHCTEIFQS